MWLLLTVALALDLAGVKAEPNLEKRSELALQYADSAVDAARDAYKRGELDNSRDALGEVRQAVELSYASLVATGKDPRKNSRYFKSAEKSTRGLMRRLESLSQFMSVVDRGMVDPVQHKVAEIHDNLVRGIMGKKK